MLSLDSIITALLSSTLRMKQTLFSFQKREGAHCLADFRPISLINRLAKVLTKLLAERLAPRLEQLSAGVQIAECLHQREEYT
jgi:hypothetical protein